MVRGFPLVLCSLDTKGMWGLGFFGWFWYYCGGFFRGRAFAPFFKGSGELLAIV